jgi:CheY-like chemotaxis protein
MPAASHKWSWVFSENTRILVVDDDPILREFASVYLSSPMSQVECVPDAMSALRALSQHEFDVVLIDIEMPGMNGLELVQRVRADEKLRAIPIVMLTSHEDINSIDQAYIAGATSFTNKPVNWRQLSYQLCNVIRANKQEGGVAALSPMPAGLQHDIAASLRAIVDTANQIVDGGGLDRDAEQARHIVAMAELTLRQLSGAKTREVGESADAADQPRVA